MRINTSNTSQHANVALIHFNNREFVAVANFKEGLLSCEHLRDVGNNVGLTGQAFHEVIRAKVGEDCGGDAERIRRNESARELRPSVPVRAMR